MPWVVFHSSMLNVTDMSSQSRHWQLAAVIVTATAVFVADASLPRGFALWLLYLPLSLACLWLGGTKAAISAAAVCSFLLVLGGLVPRDGIAIGYTVFVRTLGLVTLWAAVLGARAHYIRSSAELRAQAEALQLEIATRKQTERELLERSERFELVMSGVRDAIWDWDVPGRRIYLSPRWKRIRGLNEDEVGDSENEWLSRIHPDDHTRVIAAVREHLDGRTLGFAEEYRTQCKDGTWKWIHHRGTALRDASGKVIRMAGSETDITERRRAEQALRDSEQRFRAIVESCVDGIVTADERGIINSVNPAALHMFGYVSHELMGQELDVLTPPLVHGSGESSLASCMIPDSGLFVGSSREVMIIRKDGSEFPAHVTVTEFRARGQQRYAGFVRDISERKMLERQLLLISEREQTRIGMDLHDDLGQQITAMSIINDVMLSRLKAKGVPEAATAARLAELLYGARGQVRRIAKGLHPVEPDPKGLMAAIELHLANVAKGSGAVCTLECPVPVLMTDNDTATHLFRIVQEAVHNAVRHARPSRITVRLQCPAQHVVLEIENDGPVVSDVTDEEMQGLGLRTMRYRSGAMKGVFEMRHPASGGTIIRCVVPVSSASAVNGASPRERDRVLSPST